MEFALNLLNTTAFHMLGAPASWAEVLGALLGLAMVVCNIRQVHWGWPLALLSSLLYGWVFWGARLYAEALLQIFFALTAVWGWVQWLRGLLPSGQPLHVQRLPAHQALMSVGACVLLSLLIGSFLAQFTDSDVPWWDAIPTALSLVATALLGRKYLENWPLWIAVNLISIALFAYKGLWLTAALYAVFAVMAAWGWHTWRTSHTCARA